jgi:DNA-binding transcriptional LysR family regulator
LRLVTLCVRTGSLTSACRVIHLSLSGASHRLCGLEQALGCRLFLRRRRGLEPTRAGLLVSQHADRMIAVLDELQNELAPPASLRTSTHLAATATSPSLH